MTRPPLVRVPRAVLVQALHIVEESYQVALAEAHNAGALSIGSLSQIIKRANLLMEEGAREIGKLTD